MMASEQLCLHYSLADIQIATQNFDDELVIGKGGFGKVYEGYIKIGQGSSTVVAIKRLDSTSDQGGPEFRAEIEMLSKLRHSHLVSLLGCCDDGKEMILVYEYMPHKTVYHHLHKSNTPLTWMQRLTISIGAARGLDYLHTGAGTKHGVIHRDVKTSNILLDEDWAAKISDFGLAKICQTNQASTYVNTRVKGTFGYLDPQSVLTGKFTRKTDVFAFGVVLFELLSGRHAVFPGEDEDEDLSLASWAQDCVKRRNLDEVVDAEIRGQLAPKSLKVFAQMACRCVHMDPRERPTMFEVVAALQLSLALQEKFNNSAKPSGLIGFTWKMPSYFVLPTKESSGHGDKRSPRNNKVDISSSSEQIFYPQDFKVFSYTDLNRATRNFRYQIMTKGGWVFKGWVPSDQDVGLTITVKNVGHWPKWDVKSLGEFSHPNLQRLIGYGLDGDILYLVHEFMEKSTLNDYLDKGVVAKLPFIMRLKIAVGVARGLEFLHRKPLLLKDWILETKEIWLDKDFNAKLIYFDMAWLVDRSCNSALYPVYQKAICGVYGLGLLLLKIFTQRPIDKITEMSDEMIEDVVSPKIKLNASQIESARELLLLILKFTLNKYSMEQALAELEQIYNKMIER